jgi:Protein of unknown function (DUF2917)
MHTNVHAPSAALQAYLPGTWKLNAARAITLAPGHDAQLKVAHGQVWLTFDGPQPDTAQADYFLQAGQQIHVQRGQRVVLESFGADQAPAYFSWEPVAAHITPPVRQANRWQLDVVQPLLDLRAAGALGLRAISRLACGLVSAAAFSATDLIAFRAGFSWAARRFNAQSNAKRAHGTIYTTDSKACAPVRCSNPA